MKINFSKISALSLLFLFNHPDAANAAGFAARNAARHFVLTETKQKEVAPITGTVLDEKNLPMPGVTVKNVTTGKAVQTDVNGKFTLEAGPEDSISISFLGYQTATQKVGTQTALNFKLVPAQTELKEVKVVGVGYGTQAVREVTSAVAHVGPEDFRQSGARTPLDLIQGKVAGLNLTRTGGSNPNSGISVQLRGAVTVTGSASPLFVIDGIPGGNPDLLKQDDIESIDILKDGSGAAIYGTTANAGVIIITTKRGKKGVTQVDYSAYYRKEYLQRRLDFLTPAEYKAKIASGQLNRPDAGGATDFVDMLINHGNFSQNHNLAFSGGGENSSYRASLNYNNFEGIAKENGRKEYALRLSMNQSALEGRVRAQVDLATNFNNANLLGGGGWENEQTRDPTLSNFNADGSYRFYPTSTNEYARLFQETNRRRQQTTSANGKVDIDIVKGLTGTVFGSVVRDSRVDGGYRKKASEFSTENSSSVGGGYGFKSDFLQQDFAFEPQLQYKTTIAEKHSITALAAYSYRYQVAESASLANAGFINDSFEENNLGAVPVNIKTTSISSNKTDNTLIALLTRVNYAYNGKYLAQFIIRREGSSRFGDNNKFGYFPSVSAGWIISDEDFAKKWTFVNNLKLRAGYGITGNSGFENYASKVTMNTGGIYLFPDNEYRQTYGPDRNPNPNLKWEVKHELNFGVDFSLWNNRLRGTLDVFDRTTKDLLDTYTSPQPPFIQDRIYTNVGQMSSKGIELGLGFQAMKRADFSWDMDATFSTLKNTLDSYSNDFYKVTYKTFAPIGGAGDLRDAVVTYEGREIGEFWGKRFAGFTPDGKWLFYNHRGEKVSNAEIDVNPNSATKDIVKLGNAIPRYYASWTNTFNYKQWSLRTFLRGKFDYSILNTNALSYGNAYTWTGNLLQRAFDKDAQIKDTYMYSDYYLESGSFVKLDELTIAYNFKPKVKAIRNLRLYLTGQNLATITGYSGTDPDFVQDTGMNAGVDGRSAYPSTRSFIFGVNVGF
ncbi:SusC/RagA family TonB-linked outer membrane protein [Mucilaginibacter myungsuensis]|uniref:SusC/RagA family TonB-linked outer membrane protein n=1 Tax=Mucilaginibacter myungsuensis TaxID=649104 RepID=A0A929PZE0_9SPHI|nr:SusC/RagA family TonB-linked outer membrane protein [Mucilaginibacter myungsuensis]MBE9664400.1 SusC/RagA family TonB-linked outer membrane protein [Mucilaginibacter myungsuensis]MDN3597111.1 SusC/RagA family TonB-linked outer membrane protein [Mucilaginibacter myungsuensis]